MRRARFGVGVVGAVLLGVGGAACALAACSSSNGGGGGTGFNDSGPASGDDSSTPTCTTSSTLQIHFAPMYSAFVTDSTAQTFQVPAVVTGGTGTATWSASDATAVTFAADPTSGGTIMTLKSATPTITITAQVGTLCTSTTLNVTSAVEADWAAGNARYNNGVPLYPGCIDSKVAPTLADSGIVIPGPPEAGCPDAGPACTGCHGSNPTGGFFTGVQHTPEQTAGFTDQQLIDIFVNGVVDDGGPYSESIVPYQYWTLFHTWSDIDTPEAQKGMVVYLRSLTPAVEQGGLNFGGLADAGIVTTGQ
jgi:hypothetical protein